MYRASHARSAIAVAPQIFPFTFGDEPVNSGEAISATCSILKGDFPMDITWAFNGESISAESTDQFSITKGKRLSVLSIDAVAARHVGEYTCTVSNKAGASSHTAALAVNGNIARMYTRAYTRRLDYFLRRAKTKPSFSSSLSISSPTLFTVFSTFPHASSSTGSTMRTRLSVVWPYRAFAVTAEILRSIILSLCWLEATALLNILSLSFSNFKLLFVVLFVWKKTYVDRDILGRKAQNNKINIGTVS